MLPLLAPPPLPAAEDLLVSWQPFTRGANQRAPFALPLRQRPGRRIPRGRLGSAPLWLPREGRPRGGGRGGDRGGGVVRPNKNGGGGGRTAHSVPLPRGRSDRAAPAGGCPRQVPASVASSSTSQVSAQPLPLKTQVPGSRAPGPRGPHRAPLNSGPGRYGQVPGPGAPLSCCSREGPRPLHTRSPGSEEPR